MNVAAGPQWRIAQAEKIRAAMGPEFRAMADSLRNTFGAVKSLDWLRTDTLSMGTPIECEPIGEKAYLAERKRA